MFFGFGFCSETGTFPLPWHSEEKLSAKFWLERYLYWTRRDGVQPGPLDYFFRCLRNGRFTEKRWGYKKYTKLFKMVAKFNGYDPDGYSGLFYALGFFFGRFSLF